MVILGIDYGTRRIGLATGDSSTGLVFPLRSIERGSSLDEAIAAVLEAARAESAVHFVVGIPRRLQGGTQVGDTEREALTFVAALQAKTDLAVETEDERMSSVLADRWRLLAGTKKSKFDRDAASAAVILESYITRRFPREDISWLPQ
jgi:putative holliday junction resolvase